MNDIITLTLFAICWTAFCRLGVYIFDRICYNILDYAIKNEQNPEKQKKITSLLTIGI